MAFFLMAAVCLSPLQYALTLPVGGSPLKPSELALLLAFFCFPWTRWRRGAVSGTWAIVVIVAVMLLSAFVTLNTEGTEVLGSLPGIGRSPDGDLIFYTALGLFTLISWRLLASIGRNRLERAVVVATWVCGVATLVQFLGMLTGSVDLLEALGFNTTGSASERLSLVETRSGPFLEGQHLGFFSGFALLVCLYRRAWAAVLVALLCIFYSQSTTAVVGILAAALIVLLLRFNLRIGVGLVVTGAAFAGALGLSGSLREFMRSQLAKLGFFSDVHEYRFSTLSLDVRSTKTDIAWNMMSEHPLLGVGPGRYSVWFFDDPATADLPDYYFQGDHRAIVENVYGQIGAELGVFALMAFVLFLVVLLARVLRQRHAGLLAVFVFTCIGLWTQSSWTFLPIWIALALIAAAPGDPAPGPPEAASRRRGDRDRDQGPALASSAGRWAR